MMQEEIEVSTYDMPQELELVSKAARLLTARVAAWVERVTC